VFFTMDAGPQVKAICLPGQGEAVAAALGQIPGVESVMTSSLGPGAGTV
jgi:diphosphomevalonate decarboxylase